MQEKGQASSDDAFKVWLEQNKGNYADEATARQAWEKEQKGIAYQVDSKPRQHGGGGGSTERTGLSGYIDDVKEGMAKTPEERAAGMRQQKTDFWNQHGGAEGIPGTNPAEPPPSPTAGRPLTPGLGGQPRQEGEPERHNPLTQGNAATTTPEDAGDEGDDAGLNNIPTTPSPGDSPQQAEAKEIITQAKENPQDLNTLEQSWKRVLGLTGDKSKDATKLFIASLHAFTSGFVGKDNQILNAVFEDYRTRRDAEIGEKRAQSDQGRNLQTMDVQQGYDVAKMDKANELQKSLMDKGLEISIEQAKQLNDVEMDAAKKFAELPANKKLEIAQAIQARQGKESMGLIIQSIAKDVLGVDLSSGQAAGTAAAGAGAAALGLGILGRLFLGR